MGGLNLRLGYVCQYFTNKYRGPVTNLMGELSKSIDVVNYSCAQKHLQYYEGGEHQQKNETPQEHLTLRRYDVSFRLAGLVFPKNLTQMLSQDTPDIIQSEEYYQPATRDAHRFCKKNNVPLIINHRGSESRTRTLRERAFFKLANPLSSEVVADAEAIICLSEAGKKALCNIYSGAYEKTHVVPNSIDPLAYSPSDGAGFRREHNLPDDCPLIICVARLHPQKRVDLLVQAFAEVKKKSLNAVLCVVGPSFDAEKKKIDSLIRSLAVEDIVFTGPIPNERIKDAYAAADVVALTSEYEPFGYCLLEAMAQSKPTVAFDIGAVSEIISDGITGYTVPFNDTKALADKISALFADSGLRKKMGDAALSRVYSDFNLGENSKKLISIYESLI